MLGGSLGYAEVIHISDTASIVRIQVETPPEACHVQTKRHKDSGTELIVVWNPNEAVFVFMGEGANDCAIELVREVAKFDGNIEFGNPSS